MTYRSLVVASLLFLSASGASAQSERITVRLAPMPGQVFRMRASQQVAMNGEPDAAAASGPAMPALAMSMTSTLEYTMTTSAANEQGRYEARIVCDSADTTMLINGQAMPVPFGQTVGQVFTVAYDGSGTPVEITGGSEQGATATARQFLQGLFGQTKPLVLAIGETVTQPMNVALPMPGPVDSTMTIEGRFTLQSVSSAGGDRIAHLTTTSTVAFTPSAPGASPTGMTMGMSGEGTMDVNIDRGFAIASEQAMTIDGLITPGSAAPAMRMHGTVKTSNRVIP